MDRPVTPAVRPLVPGVVVHYALPDVQDVGLIAPITELAPSLRESYYGDSYEFACLVRSQDEKKLVYYTVPEKSITIGTPESLAAAPQTLTSASFLHLIDMREIVPQTVFDQDVLVYQPLFALPRSSAPLGVPLSPLFLASVNHTFTLHYLRALAAQLQQEPHKEALAEMWRMLTLSDYVEDCQVPDPTLTFTSRTPGVANYGTRGHDVLGNLWTAEYSGYYLNKTLTVSLGDVCRVDGADGPVRVDRILEMGPSGSDTGVDRELHIYGLTIPAGSGAEAAVPCIYPATAVQEIVGTDCADLNRLFPVTADIYNIWTIVTAEYLQDTDQQIGSFDMQTGFNFISALDVYLSTKDSEVTYATPIECSTCEYVYIQGRICHLADPDVPVEWKQNRYWNVTIPQAQPVPFEKLQACYDNALALFAGADWLYKAPCTYHYSKVSEQPLDVLLQMTSRLLQQTRDIAAARALPCCYCGKPVTGTDKIAGPFIYELVRCATPLFAAQYVAPVLVVSHHSCAYYTPEVAFLSTKDMRQEHMRILPAKRFDLAVAEEGRLVPLIVRVTALDRVSRALLTEFSPELYLNIRKTFKKTRIELACSLCGKPGALIGCYNKTCQFTVHHPCSVAEGLKFTQKREMYCQKHS